MRARLRRLVRLPARAGFEESLGGRDIRDAGRSRNPSAAQTSGPPLDAGAGGRVEHSETVTQQGTRGLPHCFAICLMMALPRSRAAVHLPSGWPHERARRLHNGRQLVGNRQRLTPLGRRARIARSGLATISIAAIRDGANGAAFAFGKYREQLRGGEPVEICDVYVRPADTSVTEQLVVSTE
jgi:hypothetical protein